MRRGAAVALAAGLLVLAAPGRTTLAPWTDPTPPTATSSLASLQLAAPTLACTASGLGSKVTWTPSSEPTALTYTAQLVSPSSSLTITSNSVTVTPSLLDGLLGGLLGSTVTVRVTASLPGTSWTVSTDRVLHYRLIVAIPTVSCT
ncbi:hypothetical protein [uncultured Nocardioides sp.]|uniref:hypothetical protein n=1 Tax=uncultured Nocardioides sp. TaxID=198441 RepID=UPI002603254F|nr:hypothetical protein [uncultured Nocardioides sp.]